MDADVAQLVREERLLEAAALSRARGDARGASALFERACDWRQAAVEAMRAGDALRGLLLAVRARDDVLAGEAVALVTAEASGADRAAAELASRGDDVWAARVFETIGRELDAARSWERAGELTRAAVTFERAREPAQAARVLEVAIRRDPDDASAAVALGALLGRFGKDEASLRALQRVPVRAPERREALRLMLGPLVRLGLTVAAGQALGELSALGGALPAREPLVAAAGSPSSPSSLDDRYRVVRQVASSAHARVLEAFDRVRGERVAVKVFAGADAQGAGRAAFERLERDARAIASLDHPAIVAIRGIHAPGPTVVSAWMDGGTLEQLLARAPVAPARAVEIVCAILSALGEGHRLGIVHRGVKPTNVLFDAAGAAHLSDFGAAHAADASATVTAGDLGTLAYQSPEQREGREVTARSDLFSAGVLLAEMLAGGRPRTSPEPKRPSEAHRDLDERHDRVVASLTAIAPDDRPTDAFRARDRLLSLPWPGASGAAPGATREERAAGELPGESRLIRRLDGNAFDTWTGRSVEFVPLSDEVLERARVFASAEHDALQTVLRVDRESGLLWLAASVAPLDRAPTGAEAERLREALEALRAVGAEAAHIDPSRAAVNAAGRVVLPFAAFYRSTIR